MTLDFSAWIGRTDRTSEPLGAAQAAAAHATFDAPGAPPGDGDPLPLLWHWFYFLPRASQTALDVDGHPQRGGFLPPIPYPRRMFAGARTQVHRPLAVGATTVREATIRDVELKSGKSGALAFVKVSYRFLQNDVLCLEEEQDIVYREAGPRVPAPVATERTPLPEESISRLWHPDSRLLFRFSALTFNAHRIHYDRPYASDEEGYPGLVVHGPLTALVLLDLAQRSTAQPVAEFRFRGQGPLFDLGPVRLVGNRAGDSIALEAQAPDGKVAMVATATLADAAGRPDSLR